MDPLRRFEYLKSNKQNAVMIRATPNSVRWDEINRVQYRFQALNFHSDVLEALIHNSPPLTRRERALTSPSKKATKSETNPDNENEKQKEILSNAQVRCIRRSASFDASNAQRDEYISKRKGSVVQIMKDDTSDYNSDEEVFSKSETGSLEKINYNATLVHVENRHITDTTQIHVTNFIPKHDSIEEQNEVGDGELIRNDETDGNQRLIDQTDLASCNEDLYNKSKEELVLLVKQLREELSHQHQNTSSQQSAQQSGNSIKVTPTLDLTAPLKSLDIPAPLTSLDLHSNTNENDATNEPQFSVSVLVNKLETQHTPTDSSSNKLLNKKYLLTSPASRVRALSAAYEKEVCSPSTTPPGSPKRSRKHISPVVGKP